MPELSVLSKCVPQYQQLWVTFCPVIPHNHRDDGMFQVVGLTLGQGTQHHGHDLERKEVPVVIMARHRRGAKFSHWVLYRETIPHKNQVASMVVVVMLFHRFSKVIIATCIDSK